MTKCWKSSSGANRTGASIMPNLWNEEHSTRSNMYLYKSSVAWHWNTLEMLINFQAGILLSRIIGMTSDGRSDQQKVVCIFSTWVLINFSWLVNFISIDLQAFKEISRTHAIWFWDTLHIINRVTADVNAINLELHTDGRGKPTPATNIKQIVARIPAFWNVK